MSNKVDIVEERFFASNSRPIHAGDTYDMAFTLKVDGTLVDLTNAGAWFTVKESSLEEDSEAKLFLIGGTATDGSSDEIEFTDPTNGVLVVKLRGSGGSQKDTSDLYGQWNYDLQVKLSDGTIITAAYGIIDFLPNFTRTNT